MRDDVVIEMLTVIMNLLGGSRPTTGVERYALELLPRLLAAEPAGSRLLVLVDGKDRGIEGMDASELSGRLLSFRPAALGPRRRHLATQVSLPLMLRRYPKAVLYSPMNVGCLGWRRQVLVMHDVAWRLFPGAYRRSYRALYRTLFAGYRRRRLHLVCDSSAVASEIRSLSPSNPISVISPGPGKSLPDTAARRPREGPRSRVLWVGSVQERKDLPTALAASSEAAQLLDRRVDLLVAGATAQPFRRPVVRAPDGVNLEFAEGLSDDGLEAAYQWADVLLFTSRYEGFGFPPLESLSRGLPVISSDLPPLRELTLTGARFVEPGDVEAFAHAIAEELGSSHPAPTQPPPLSWERCAECTWKVLQEAACL